ncbi:RBPJ-interacting and tubulin-associated protein 1 [Echinops telfairi]|uniref:RBPJ-interacting and tubulin-associated protein 1 n=2 Tax=Echinops telfairi TaxID=9371 RepID=A0ABM0IWT5_ECHTE|nr:RBPJ-interacting and tubulin-associated protein 1 [Echinops telfairi]XP_045152713.1 RBPJ-interacting and tubulin-associated protein 1 [Echinops telfairi]
MRAPPVLAVSGMQTIRRQHSCHRGGQRLKARASFVDETLFGSPAGTRPSPPDFDPPWVGKANGAGRLSGRVSRASDANKSCESTPPRGSTPTLTPRKNHKYRLVGHTPSYCDESLFGSRTEGAGWEAPWMAKGDAAKLQALFWTPPATPRGSHSPRPRETPLRAVHPASLATTHPGAVAAADSCKLPLAGFGATEPVRRPRSRSLTHLTVPGTSRPPTSVPHANGPRDPRPPLSGVTSRSPLTPRAPCISTSAPATPRRGGAPQKPKPPWK